jgi:ribosome-binding factor A
VKKNTPKEIGMHRAQRVSSLLKEEVSWILERELKDPEVSMVTIVEVELSKDFRLARVYFSSLASDEQALAELKALNKASPFIRKLLYRRLDLKMIPELTFERDTAFEYARRIEVLLARIHENR